MAVSRSHRIAEQIQRELAELIRLEVRDPRVRLVTLPAAVVPAPAPAPAPAKPRRTRGGGASH